MTRGRESKTNSKFDPDQSQDAEIVPQSCLAALLMVGWLASDSYDYLRPPVTRILPASSYHQTRNQGRSASIGGFIIQTEDFS